MNSRGVSTVLGFALIILIVIGGMVGILLIGQESLVETRNQITVQNAENAMSSLASNVALVAFDTASRQSATIGQGHDLQVHPNQGRVTITIDRDGSRHTVVNTSLGAITTGTGTTTIAYQGGGVWRDSAGGAQMVSPPEFHYRENTLTFPLIVIDGHGTSTTLAFSKNATEEVYPGEKGHNPVTGDVVYVNVTSQYHHGWYTYFKQRTSAEVIHDPDQNRVVAKLTTPIEEQFGQSVSTTVDELGAITHKGSAYTCLAPSKEVYECPIERGATAPSASSAIDEWINTCENDNDACTEFDSAADNGTVPAGVYFIHSDITFSNQLTFNATSGNVTLVVDADTAFKGNADIDITGDGGVAVYQKGKMTFKGTPEINTGGNAGDLLTLVHSNVSTIGEGGNPQYTGLIYAPNTNFSIKGGGHSSNVIGSVVVETASINSQAGSIEHADEIDLRIDPALDPDVTYLHVTRNRVNVST